MKVSGSKKRNPANRYDLLYAPGCNPSRLTGLEQVLILAIGRWIRFSGQPKGFVKENVTILCFLSLFNEILRVVPAIFHEIMLKLRLLHRRPGLGINCDQGGGRGPRTGRLGRIFVIERARLAAQREEEVENHLRNSICAGGVWRVFDAHERSLEVKNGRDFRGLAAMRN